MAIRCELDSQGVTGADVGKLVTAVLDDKGNHGAVSMYQLFEEGLRPEIERQGLAHKVNVDRLVIAVLTAVTTGGAQNR